MSHQNPNVDNDNCLLLVCGNDVKVIVIDDDDNIFLYSLASDKIIYLTIYLIENNGSALNKKEFSYIEPCRCKCLQTSSDLVQQIGRLDYCEPT